MTRIPRIKIRPSFDWRKVVWRRREGSQPGLCSYCQGKIGGHPPVLCKDEGVLVARFCDICIEAMVGAAE